MAEAIRMPRMSDTMTEGVIVDWRKKVGDKIKPGDVLAEVETDKATMELESYNEGTILYIGPKKGDKVPVENVIAVVGKEGESFEHLLDPKNVSPAQPASAPAPQGNQPVAAQAVLPKGVKVIRMPLLSDTMTEGKIVKWNKKVGDTVKSDDSLADVETDKATMEVVGYEDGTLLYIATEAGQAAPINGMIALVGPAGTDVSAYVAAQKNNPEGVVAATTEAPVQSATPTTSHMAPATNNTDADGRVKASPLAKKIAKEKGIDLATVHGSGDGGRIVKRDIDNYVPAQAIPAVQSAAPAAKESAIHMHAFAPVGQEGYTDIPNSQMRLTIARRLGESKFNAPHFYLTMEINMDQAMAARKAMNEVSPVKISFNDIVIKACAMALREHPEVNSSWMGEFIRQNQHIHIGSAVAMPDGLIVPVIRFADQKSLAQIATEAKSLYDKARNKKLQPNEFSGNTFTISNLGMMDIDQFTAIINPPDSAILAVGRIKEEVVRKGDGFGVTNVMKVTLSCDHRSVDGAVGAAFLQTVKAFLENPVRMLI